MRLALEQLMERARTQVSARTTMQQANPCFTVFQYAEADPPGIEKKEEEKEDAPPGMGAEAEKLAGELATSAQVNYKPWVWPPMP